MPADGRDSDTIEVGALAIRPNGRAAPGGGRLPLSGVATCWLDGVDIEATIVRQGLARDYQRFSGGRYAEAELQTAADGATIGGVYSLPGYCK